MTEQPNDLRMRIERRLMAPCCYTQTIAVHMSDIAQTMRAEVASMVRAGQSEAQIYEHYKALYGEQILAIPDGVLGTVAFAIPTCVATIATGSLAFILYRFHQRKNALARLPAVTDQRRNLPATPQDEEGKRRLEKLQRVRELSGYRLN